jgi:hypothetical protein
VKRIAVFDHMTGHIKIVPMLLVLLTGVGFSLGPGASSASAIACRSVVNPPEAVRYNEGTGVVGASPIYTVPGSSVSGCADINVVNVFQDGPQYGISCAFFRVRFFPSAGGNYANSWRSVCSNGPNGPVVPIATSILNGTRYRVEYQLNGGMYTPTYTIRD